MPEKAEGNVQLEVPDKELDKVEGLGVARDAEVGPDKVPDKGIDVKNNILR